MKLSKRFLSLVVTVVMLMTMIAILPTTALSDETGTDPSVSEFLPDGDNYDDIADETVVATEVPTEEPTEAPEGGATEAPAGEATEAPTEEPTESVFENFSFLEIGNPLAPLATTLDAEENVEITSLSAIKDASDTQAMAFVTEVVIPATKKATLYMTVGRAAEFDFAQDTSGVTVKYAAYIHGIPDTAEARATQITASVRAEVDGEDVDPKSLTASWDTAIDVGIIDPQDLSQVNYNNIMTSKWKSTWTTQE